MRLILTFFFGLNLILSTKISDIIEVPRPSFIQVKDKEIVSFIYHRFGDNRYPSTNTSLENFEAHINYLKSNDYQIVTLSQAIEYLNSDQPIQKTAVLTIDDGYKSFITKGFPILKKHGVTATLFINTEVVGYKDFIDWEGLKMLSDEGIEIGNHSETHPYFLNLPEASRYRTFRKELINSQQVIQARLGITPKVFAYPYGEYDNKMKTIVREVGFTAAVAQNSGVIHSSTDPYRMPRYPMTNTFANLPNFIEKAQMKSFVVLEESPSNFLLKFEDVRPELRLKFEKSNLRLDRLQCFVQGGDCEMKITENDDFTVTLIAKAKSSLKARRTLYTITVLDENGKWHWYSHLWIKPELK